MLENHIPLNRSFNKIDVDSVSDNSQEYDGSWRFGLNQTKWADILESQRVIILAEAGAGKTEEIMAVTYQLREDGKNAFFFRLEHLHDDFELAFEIGDIDEFNNWKKSNEKAWFFLDSVDEARLGSPHQYERAIKKFAKYLGSEKQRASIYITSRSSEWRPKADFAFFKTHLPFLSVQTEGSDKNNYEDIGSGSELTNDRGISAGKKTSVQGPLVYSLAPLDDTQIKIYAEALDVSDTESFLTAIEKAEAKDFTTRPLDLEELIEYWEKNKKIANRKELIEFTISRRLIELDTERDQARPLNKADATKGVELIASATTFQKIFRISVPDGNLGKKTETSLPMEDILVDWDSKKIRALLARPIFDKETYGAVRFYHRSIREFLTARWLSSLLINRVSRQKIESIFFQERYGCISVVPSLCPVLSWLITFDEEISKKTLQIAPELLIQGGDPSALPISVRKKMLNDMCQNFADKSSHLNLYSFDIGELRRFTHSDLSKEINKLLRKYSQNSGICELLLRMIWQGELQGCNDIALEFAKDSSLNIYTQLNGLRVIEVVGSDAQKQELVDSLFLRPQKIKERIASDIISAYAPNILTVSQVLHLVEQMNEPERYSHSELQSTLEVFVREKCSIDQCYEWALGLAKLLERPPSKDSFDTISSKYEWLLLYGAIAIERLIGANDDRIFEEFSLAIISFCEAVSIHQVSKLEKQQLDKIIPDESKLSRMLFWYDVRKYRKIGKQERLIDYWHANAWNSYWKFIPDDIEWVIDQIKERDFIDDKLVALSLAFKLYVDGGRNRSLRDKLKKVVVKGNHELEESLAIKLNPPAMDEEEKKYKRQSQGWKQKRKRREKREKANKEKWIKNLKEDHKHLLDTSVAEKGQVWNSQLWLSRELDKDGGSIQVTNWIGLIPVFGEPVAKAFRDGAIDYWRKHTPELKSEVNDTLIHYSTRFGLSGIGMEYELYGNRFFKSLSVDEAVLIAKYAIKELNGFPNWFHELFLEFSTEVKNILLVEIEWEISEYKGEAPPYYILADVNYHAEWIRNDIANDVLTLISNNKPFHDDTTQKALTLILSSNSISSDSFINVAKNKIKEEGINNSEKAIWFAGWVSMSPNDGINTLETFIKNISIKDESTELMMGFITSLMGRDRIVLEGVSSDYRKPSILSKIIKLSYQHISVENDIDRSGGGVYSPTLRDDAQDCRGSLFSMLVDIPGKQTYLVLKELEKYFENSWMKERCASLAKQRAVNDSEFFPWGASDVISFGESLEKNPQNNRELYELSISKLLDIKYDLEQGDSSEAQTWKKIEKETELRVMLGNSLRGLSNFYSVPQEEELADKKKPDLRTHHPAIDAPVPIELKIVDNGWSVNSLKERIENQLIGQYLRDQRSMCGIFLLVYRGDKKYWEYPDTKEELNFSDLVSNLRIFSDQLLMEKSSVEAIEVIGIDLTLRMKSS